MRTHHLVSFSALLLAATLPAQAVVSPAHFTAAAGNSNGYAGVGHYASISRHLQIHDDLAGTARTLHGIAFRRDTPSTSQIVPANNLVCDLFVSTASTTATTPNATFDANHGNDKQQVAGFQLFQLPASPPSGATMPFAYALPFPQQYTFGGQGPLAWEIRVYSSNTGGGILLDGCSGSGTNPQAAVASSGSGCRVTGESQPMTLAGSSTANWPIGSITASYTGQRMPKSALASLVFGGSKQAWSPLSLPFELPGSASAPSGACNVYCDWVALLPGATDATGKLTTSVGGAVNPGMHGGSLFAQAVVLDANANGFGIVTSNLVEQQIIAPFANVPVGQVSLASSHGATGSVTARRGAIVKFD